jgi:hypothetical protein
MAAAKTRLEATSVAGFIAAIADDARRADCATVVAMMREATGCEPRMWGASIIGFDRYRYLYASGQEGDWPIVGLSPRKQALTLYLSPGFAQRDALLAKLGSHSTGKACLYVKRLADIDLAVLRALVEASVAQMRKQSPR